MTRPWRIEYTGTVCHITTRGNARESIYRDDRAQGHFLILLGREINQQGGLCHAYCTCRVASATSPLKTSPRVLIFPQRESRRFKRTSRKAVA